MDNPNLIAPPAWDPIDRGLTRYHPIWGRQSVYADADNRIEGNVFLTFSSGTGSRFRSVQHSLTRDDAEHLMACIEQVFGVEPDYAEPAYRDDPLHNVLEQVA